MALKFFNRICVYELLEAIDRNPGITPHVLVHDETLQGSPRTRFVRIHELMDMGLIKCVRKEDERWNSHGAYLTETGRKALELLDRLKEMEMDKE